LIMCYKVLHNMVSIDCNALFQRSPSSSLDLNRCDCRIWKTVEYTRICDKLMFLNNAEVKRNYIA